MNEERSLELQVVTDDLTGLFNRRYLNLRLAEEVENSRERRSGFGLVMLDLDHFKEVNDNYGHDEGDQGLLWITDILKKSVRSEDIVIRFAGDEFFLILPGAGESEARLVSERIYKNIKENPFRGSKSQVTVPLGISGGIAVFPEDADDVEAIKKEADKGLYLAKELGRGKICLAKDAKQLNRKRIDKSTLLTPPFCGRDSELTTLKKAFRQVEETEKLAVALVRGDTGMGKSRLVTEFLNNVGSDKNLCLKSFCLPHEFEIPYQPVMDLISGWVDHDKDTFQDIFDSLPEQVKLELTRLIPKLAEFFVDSETDKFDATPDNSRLYYGMTQFFQAVAEKYSLIINLEDLQWIDQSSMDLLAHITAQSRSHKIFILMNTQPVSPDSAKGAEINRFLRRLGREVSWYEIKLLPINEKGINDLLEKIFRGGQGSELDQVSGLLVKESEGNPLFIREILLRLIEEKILFLSENGWVLDHTKKIETPERIKDVVTDRIELIDEELKEILQKAAVIGKEFSFGLLLSILDVKEGYLLDMLDHALAGAFLQETDANEEIYSFTSFQVQKELYDQLSRIRRRRYHKQILDILENDRKLKEKIELIFMHAERAGDEERIVDFGLKSAEKAYLKSALKEARHFYSSVFKAWDNLDDSKQEELSELYKLSARNYAETLILLGEFDEAVLLIDSLEIDDYLREKRGVALFRKGRFIEAEDIFKSVLASSDNNKIKSRIYCRLSELLRTRGLTEESKAAADHAYDFAVKEASRKDEAFALKAIGTVWLIRSNFEKSIELFQRAISIFEEINDKNGIAGCLINIGIIFYKQKKYDQAQEKLHAAGKICEEYGFLVFLLMVYNNLGSLYFDKEEFDEACVYFKKCKELGEDTGEINSVIASLINLSRIYLQSKDNERSKLCCNEGLSICRETGARNNEASFYSLLAEISILEGDYTEADKLYEKGITLSRDIQNYHYELYMLIKQFEVQEKTDYFEPEKVLSFIEERFKEIKDTFSKENQDFFAEEIDALKKK